MKYKKMKKTYITTLLIYKPYTLFLACSITNIMVLFHTNGLIRVFKAWQFNPFIIHTLYFSIFIRSTVPFLHNRSIFLHHYFNQGVAAIQCFFIGQS